MPGPLTPAYLQEMRRARRRRGLRVVSWVMGSVTALVFLMLVALAAIGYLSGAA